MQYILTEFAEKQLPNAFGVHSFVTDYGEPALDVQHPVAVARLLSFAKARAQTFGGDVYLRGQSKDHVGMTPALFRNAALADRLADAYGTVMGEIGTVLPFGRFRRENPGAVFQHYGLRTPWLDLVDNLYTATWFALHSHEASDGRGYYFRSQQPYGWLYLVVTRHPDGRELQVADLRKEQSSMNVRLHVQHGMSVATQGDNAPIVARDYGAFVLGRIRIPNDRRFRQTGALSTTRFVFPPIALDASYSLLLKRDVTALLADAERRHGLPSGAVGRIERVAYRRR